MDHCWIYWFLTYYYCTYTSTLISFVVPEGNSSSADWPAAAIDKEEEKREAEIRIRYKQFETLLRNTKEREFLIQFNPNQKNQLLLDVYLNVSFIWSTITIKLKSQQNKLNEKATSHTTGWTHRRHEVSSSSTFSTRPDDIQTKDSTIAGWTISVWAQPLHKFDNFSTT